MWIFVRLNAQTKPENPIQVSYEYPPGYKVKTPKYRKPKHYGFFHLCFDFVLTIFTSGIWLIWILIRYLRSNTK